MKALNLFNSRPQIIQEAIICRKLKKAEIEKFHKQG